ncbi:MAG TPA: PAS domain S-box protein, partial [Nitrospira sp.]
MADSDTSKEAGATGLVDLKAKVMMLEETIHFYEQELNRSRTQTALMRALLSATDPSNQEDVFHAIVYQLAGSLNARHAVLGAIHGEGPERRVDTIAVMVDGEFATNFSYRLEGMPCAQTLHERILYYEAGLQDRFPDAELVKNLGAESYCGFPLYGSSGRLIGILAVLDRQPLSISEDLHPLLMLYAARAGAELQRQQAESARRESDRRIRLTQFAVDHAVDGVVWADDKERLIYANESICRSLGYSQEELLLLGIPDIEVRPDRICSMQRHEDIKQGRAAASESWFRRKDGTQFPVEVSFTYLEQEGRGYICGIARDITERKRVEQERAQALYDLRNIMETVPDFMFTLDCQGNLVRWNSRVAEVTGYTPEELWLKHALAFVPPEERDRTAAAIQQALATGYAELDGHLLTKTHVLIPYHWTGAALRNPQGDIIGITGVGRDVSEKKRVEQRMLEQREHLVMAQALAHLGSWDWHLTTGEVAWSDEQYRIFGHEPGSMCVTYDTFLTALLPEDHDRVLKAVNDALAGRTPYNIECRIVRPNGEVRVVHCMGEVRRDDEGRALTMDGTSLDITDRKNIEEALRASDERWHLAVCGSNDGIWDWKILTNEIFFSSRWKSMRGFQDHELPNSLDEWRSRIHPEDLDRVLQAIDRYLAGACSEYCEEYRVERKDGTYMWILDRGMALWADDGTPLRMAGSESDITERKRAEQGLKESEERYRMLVDLSPSGIFVYCEGAIVYVNHAACRILGAEAPEEVLMHPTLHFVHPDCHEAVMDGANALLMNGAPVRRVERKYLKVDRTVIDVEVEAAPITWNGKPAIQGMFSDITDRKRAEQVLRESEELFAKAFRSSPDPMVISELDSGLCLDVNDACLIGFGYRRDDVVGRTGDVIGHWPTSEDRLRFVKRLKQDGPIRNFETAIRTASGEFRDCLVSAELIEYHGKSCMVTVGKDITERKRAEEALRASEERYARATAVGKVGVWELDVTTGMYHGDANLKALFGYGPEELSTDPYMWLQLVHPDDRSTAMHAWEQVLGGSTDEYHYEIRMIRKDGMTIWTEVRGHALRDHQNSVTHLIGATVDITERHDAQVDLRRTDDHLRALIQVSPLAIVTTDADGNVLSWNPGAEALFGWTEREVGGHPFPWLSGEETSD